MSKIPSELFLEISEAIVGYIIRTINNYSVGGLGNLILVVSGEKAFEAYIEKPYRDDTIEWELFAYNRQENFDEKEELQTVASCCYYGKDILKKMITVKYIVKSILKNIGISYKDSDELDVKFTNSTIQQGFNGYVYEVGLFFGNVLLTKLFNVRMVTGSSIYSQTLDRIKSCKNEVNYLTDDLRSYFDLKSLEDYLIDDAQSEDDQTRLRFEPLYDTWIKVKEAGHIHCEALGKLCYDRVIFDFTDKKLDGFKLHSLQYPAILEDDKKFIEAINISDNDVYFTIEEYTGNAFREINGALLMQYYYAIQPTGSAVEWIRNLDKMYALRAKYKQPEVFKEPLILFRLGRYTTLSKEFGDINLFKVKPGHIFPLVIFTSATYTNKNPKLAVYNSESHFKGVVFVISCYSNRDMVCLESASQLPKEKEFLLNRNGQFKVTKVSWDYVSGECKNNIKLYEKMIIYCDFIPYQEQKSEPIPETKVVSQTPPVTIGGNDESFNLHVFIDCKNRDFNQPKINEYFGDIVSLEPWIYKNSTEHCVLSMKYLAYLVAQKQPQKITETVYAVQTPSGIAYITENVAGQIIPYMYQPLMAGLRIQKLEPIYKPLQSFNTASIPIIVGAGLTHLFNVCTAALIVLLIIVVILIIVKVVRVHSSRFAKSGLASKNSVTSL